MNESDGLHKFPLPNSTFSGPNNPVPAGYDLETIGKAWRPNDASPSEAVAATVSRMSHRLVDVQGNAKTLEEIQRSGSVSAPLELDEVPTSQVVTSQGTQQKFRVTPSETATNDGTAVVTVTAAGLSESPISLTVNVTSGNFTTAAVKAAIQGNEAIMSLFSLNPSSSLVELRANLQNGIYPANDPTALITITPGTVTGITTQNSTITVEGVAGVGTAVNPVPEYIGQTAIVTVDGVKTVWTAVSLTEWKESGSDLTSGPVTSSGGVSAIADGALSIAKTDNLQPLLDGKAPSLVKNLANFRRLISETPFPKPTIFLFGDSMIGTSSGAMLTNLQNTFGQSGQNLDVALTGGATILNDSCNFWLNGTTYPITASGHAATLGTSGGTFAVLGNLLKLYYVIEPGAGTFQVQISENGGAFVNEGGVVNAAGTLAGGVWTATKTTWRANYRIRAVWVSGSTKIIGGRVEDTTRRGGRYFFISNGSSEINNIDNAATNTPAAIVNPIMADIAPNLCIMSHLDGAAQVVAHQANLQNKITTGVTSAGSGTPSWVIVGPPTTAVSEAQDTLQAEQAEAQRLLAISRFDAFFDNRLWALPWSTSEARGLFTGGDKVHYSGLAQDQWIPAMISELGLDKARVLGAGKVEELTIGNRKFTFNPTAGTLDFDGSMRFHGSSNGLLLEDQASPANTNDFGSIAYNNNIINLYGSGANRWAFNGSVGQANFYSVQSTASVPNGDLGLAAFPWRSLHVSKKVNANTTVGNVTADAVAGRVWFDVGGSSITVTNARVAADSVITASVLGSDATATSVRVTTVSAGSFVLTLNAAATAKTEVSFFLIP